MSILSKTSISSFILVAALGSQLTACVPVVAGGAAAGGLMAADRRSSGAYIEDQEIELKASKAIDDSLKSNVHANITSYNRHVLITGEVSNEANKAKAESLVKPIQNVNSINNQLVIGANSSISARSNDAYITSKVKTNFLTENKFAANHVKVVTENGTVFLLGLVTHKEGDDAAEIARTTSGVKKVVKDFEYID
ncbi:MAG: BON domain-containing protein [Methylophilaceae bacterium]|jgi:osmotically-inducible protein OsmY|nr:BON domain-containing protein [Methylophilaceae bacterium]